MYILYLQVRRDSDLKVVGDTSLRERGGSGEVLLDIIIVIGNIDSGGAEESDLDVDLITTNPLEALPRGRVGKIVIDLSSTRRVLTDDLLDNRSCSLGIHTIDLSNEESADVGISETSTVHVVDDSSIVSDGSSGLDVTEEVVGVGGESETTERLVLLEVSRIGLASIIERLGSSAIKGINCILIIREDSTESASKCSTVGDCCKASDDTTSDIIILTLELIESHISGITSVEVSNGEVGRANNNIRNCNRGVFEDSDTMCGIDIDVEVNNNRGGSRG
jgi:hypothetical protein